MTIQNAKFFVETQDFASLRLMLLILFLLPVYLIKIKFGWISFNALEILIGLLFIVWIFNKEKKYSILSTKYFLANTL